MNQMRINFNDTTMDEGTRLLHDGNLYTGEVVETDDDDGTILCLNTYKDGYEDGIQKEWYRDGSPKSVYRTVKGSPVGESEEWYDNGQLAIRQEFDQWGTVRKRDEWDENGEPLPGRAINTWNVGEYPVAAQTPEQ
jgi:antitoxin component YwqK of YwqJK toxin-antitoxin module